MVIAFLRRVLQNRVRLNGSLLFVNFEGFTKSETHRDTLPREERAIRGRPILMRGKLSESPTWAGDDIRSVIIIGFTHSLKSLPASGLHEWT